MTRTRTRSRARTRAKGSGPSTGPTNTKPTSDTAREHYHREKARRARRIHADSEVMAAARREYLALLEAEAAKGKGGRPKKKPAVRSDALGEEDEAPDE